MATVPPTNLNEYYSAKGLALPSLSERAKTYESSGLGSATAYQGSIDQNTQLLNRLLVPAAPINNVTKTEIPGVGTLTTQPKIQTATGKPAPTEAENLEGLYQRTGVSPAPALTSSPTPFQGKNFGRIGNDVYEVMPDGTQRYISGDEFKSKLGGLNLETLPQIEKTQAPVYKPQQESKYSGISSAYSEASKKLAALEASLMATAAPTPEEKILLAEVQKKRDALAKFDVDTLKKTEAMSGTGRGQTLDFVVQNQEKERRTAALERLGLSTEAQSLVDQLGNAQELRGQQRQAFQDSIGILDKQLGIQDKMLSLDIEEANDARNYLLDVISFSDGKSFDELDADTKQAIVNEVAKTPLTLDMVKTSLDRAREEAFTKEAAGLRDDSRAILADVLEKFQGKSFGELSKADQDSLMKLANDSGLSTSLLISGMAAVKTEYQRKLSKDSSTSSTALKFSQEERQRLIGAGFNAADIDGIQRDLNSYGLGSVTEGLDANQKSVLSSIVNGTTAETPTKLTRSSISGLYGIPDDNEKSGFLGFGKTNKEKLDELMNTIQRYQGVGYSDVDILKLIKG